MTTDNRTRRNDGTRAGALWTGVLVPPLASLAALQAGYVLAQRGCATGQMLPVHLGFLAATLAALAAGGLAWREWRRWGDRTAGEDGGPGGRSRFLALIGLLAGPLFAFVIVAQWSASLFLHPCQ